MSVTNPGDPEPTNLATLSDDHDRLVSHTDSGGHQTTYGYCSSWPDFMTNANYPGGFSMTYTPDAQNHGNLESVSDSDGIVTNYSYAYPAEAPFGRVTQETVSGPDIANKVTGFTYRTAAEGLPNYLSTVTLPTSEVVTYSYDTLAYNSLSSIAGTGWNMSFEYTNPNNTSLPRLFGRPYFVTGVDGKKSEIQYDNLKRPTAFKDPLGNTTTVGYNAYDQVTSVLSPSGPMSIARQLSIARNTSGTP